MKNYNYKSGPQFSIRFMFNVAIAIAATTLVVSCRKTCKCLPEGLTLAYVGYTPDQIDSITVKRYMQGTDFSALTDSFYLRIGNAYFRASGDTIMVEPYPSLELTEGQDYEITNPFDRKTTRVADITVKHKEESTSAIFALNACGCTSPITLYKRDGVNTDVSSVSGKKTVFINR